MSDIKRDMMRYRHVISKFEIYNLLSACMVECGVDKDPPRGGIPLRFCLFYFAAILN